MIRILVVVGRRLDIARFRDELICRDPADLDVFVLYLVRDRVPELMRRRRFWRNRHEELEDALGTLTRIGVLSDGLTTRGNPVEWVQHALETVRPDKVIVVRTPLLERYEVSLRRLFDARPVGDGEPITTSWISD